MRGVASFPLVFDPLFVFFFYRHPTTLFTPCRTVGPHPKHIHSFFFFCF